VELSFWHNPGVIRIPAAAALALVLSACVTPPPSVGSDRLRALVAQREACADAACRSGAQHELLALSEKASAAAGTARQERQRIGHLRVAGLAAWQAGDPGRNLTARANETALARCRTLDALAHEGVPVGTSDDCAVLEALPALVAHADALRQIERLATAAPDASARYALETLVADYPSQTFLLLADLGPRLLAYEGLSPATARWLVAIRRRTFCDYRRVRDVTAAWPEQVRLTLAVERQIRRESAAAGANFDGCAAVPPVGLPPGNPRTR